MFPKSNIHDRRTSIKDEQAIFPKKSQITLAELKKPQKQTANLVPSMTRIQRSPNSKLSVVSRNDNRKSTVNSNMSSNYKRHKLLQEYQDLFQKDSLSSDSGSSSDNQSKMSKQQKHFANAKSVDKEIDEEQELIKKTLNQRLSTFSKQRGQYSLKSSQFSQMKQTAKSMKSMKQMSSFNRLKSSHYIPTTKFRKENSISSSSKEISSDHGGTEQLQSLIKILDKVGVSEPEQHQYAQILDEIEKQCIEALPQGRQGQQRIRSKVRTTFIQLFNQQQQEQVQKQQKDDIASSYSIGQNESVMLKDKIFNESQPLNGQITKVQSNFNVTSIMENLFTKNSSQLPMNEKMKILMENFQQELEFDDDNDSQEEEFYEQSEQMLKSDKSSEWQNDQDEENEDEIYEIQQSYDQKKKKKDQLEYLMKTYEKRIISDPVYDHYSLVWISRQDYLWTIRDFKNYWDTYPFITLRKTFVMIVRIGNITINKIVKSNLFTLCVLTSIVFNIVVFIQSKSDNLDDQTLNELKFKKKIILYLFVGESVLKILGLGPVQYFLNLLNIFDVIILILFFLNFTYPEYLVVDFSTVRLLRFLLYMSLFSKRLKIMILALSKSVKFLAEALVIVILFSYFFALFGMHLFQGLFVYRCINKIDNTETSIGCGYNYQCTEEQYCEKTNQNPNVPTNFDDIFYSYLNIVRLMIFNEWTEPIYFGMWSFHDFTVIYFILITLIVGIFGSNLIIAVLKIYFSQTLEKYEFEEIKEEVTNEEIMLNLRIAKNYNIDQILKENNKQIIQRKNQNNNNDRTATNYQATINQATYVGKTINFGRNINYKHKYLSARQTREQEEIRNRKRGIKAKKNKLDSLIEQFTLSHIFLSNENQDQFFKVLYQNEQFDQSYFKLFYLQTLKENPLYSWRSEIKQMFDYESTSINDIFSIQKQNEIQNSKRDREFEFIRKFSMKQYYVMKKSEYSFTKNAVTQLALTETHKGTKYQTQDNDYKSQNKIIYPLFKRFKKSISEEKSTKIQIFLPKIPSVVDNIIIRDDDDKIIQQKDKVQQTIKKQKQCLKQCDPQLIVIGEEEYNLDGMKQLFKKGIPETINELPSYEDLYVQYRLEECKQQMIYKHNWSGKNVLKSKVRLSNKIKIFKVLNKIDIEIWLVGISGLFRSFQKHLFFIFKNKYYKMFFDLIVLINIVLLSLNGFVDAQLIHRINDYLVVVLVAELLLKLIYYGIIRFCSSFTHIFDTVILTCAMIQTVIIWQQPNESNTLIDLLNALQAILCYRIIKYNNFAVKIANVTRKSLPSFFNLILLMFTLILIFAFIGMDLYQYKFPTTTELGLQQSFNDIGAAFLTVFTRASMEDWFGMVILGTQYSYKVPTAFYSISMVYILNLMTFGLVLAIILDAFQSYATVEQENEEEYRMDSEVSEIINMDQEQNNYATLKSEVENENIVSEKIILERAQESQKTIINQVDTQFQKNKQQFFNPSDTINNLVEFLFKEFQFFTNKESAYSLFVFSQENTFRKLCYRLVNFSFYKNIIQLLYIIVLLNMSIYTYFDYENQSKKEQTIQIINNIEIIIDFTLFVDSILKIISFGFMRDQGAFTSELWRFIDFIYQISSIVNFIQQNNIHYYLQYLKYARTFRFLYLFSELKYINDAVTKSMLDLINLLFVQITVWIIFAIFGMIIYQGKMGYCQDPLNFEVNKIQCEEEGERWIVNMYNFDNFANAMLTLYRITACDDWISICFVCLNSRNEDLGPILYGNRSLTFIFFLLFILVGVLFFMGFFAGILFINFQTNKKLLQNEILSKDQQLFSNVTQLILKEVPQYSDPPTTLIRKLASGIIKYNYYEQFILLTIIINTCTLTLFYDLDNNDSFSTLEIIYQILSCIYIVDSIIKLLAFGLVRYWGFVWRKIELVLSIVALIDLILYLILNWSQYYKEYTIHDDLFILVRLFFALRNLRLLLVIQQFKGLTRLLRILNFSASYLFQILCFFLSIVFFYGFIGCQFFGEIQQGNYLQDYMNFTNIGKVVLVLYKIATKNNWVNIMIDVSERNKYCTSETPEYCGVKWYYANLYFYSYLPLAGFIGFNLFITSLVDQFEKFFHSQNSVLQTYIENIDPFRTTWCKYSTETKGVKMHSKHLANFLLELGPPLGSQSGDNIWDAAKNAANFKIRADGEGYIHFQEVLYETIRFVYRDQIFKTGTPESISIMKSIDKDTRFRLHFKRIDIFDRREPIFATMQIKGNFNILQEYLFLLMIFRTLKTYSVKTIGQIQKHLVCQNSTSNNLDGKQFQRYETKNSDESEYEQPNSPKNNNNKSFKHEITCTETSNDNIQIPKYVLSRGNKKLKFIDQLSQTEQLNLIFQPDTGQQTLQVEHKVKSALKKPTFNFMDFEKFENKNIHNLQNPMLDSSQSHIQESHSQMTDSLINQEEELMNVHGSQKSQARNLRFSMSSNEDVGTETHCFFRGKPQKEGRQY